MRELIADMKAKNWMIESFLFTYNNVACVVTIQLYTEDDKNKPHESAQAKIIFRKQENMTDILKAYANYTKVNFFDATDFYKFFNIQSSNGSEPKNQVFKDFSDYFMSRVPTYKTIQKDNVLEKEAILLQLDEKENKGRYCYTIKRNAEGDTQTIFNANKAEMLKPELYEEFKGEPRYSFCFSEDPEKEKTDNEIRINFARNNPHVR